ncbi:spore germination protein GerPE [Paenibacillus sp. HB172176]|uniref:spore germination protein GerPE n=1 Tax=Paenibacillus sp. HB172176 TaxID=2493690 RepID=UPI00143AC084|nr:spore germination protein GerPE [Paenibacillus sp. HB172176]
MLTQSDSFIPPKLSGANEVRTARLGCIRVISIASSGMLQIGDRCETRATINALAVQRAEDHLTAGSVYFESYPFFERPWPSLQDTEFDEDQALELSHVHCSNAILVGAIYLIAAGSSSSILVGNSKKLTATTRIKHIRQFPLPKPEPSAEDKPYGGLNSCRALLAQAKEQ